MKKVALVNLLIMFLVLSEDESEEEKEGEMYSVPAAKKESRPSKKRHDVASKKIKKQVREELNEKINNEMIPMIQSCMCQIKKSFKQLMAKETEVLRQTIETENNKMLRMVISMIVKL